MGQNPNLQSSLSSGSITPGQKYRNRTHYKKRPQANDDLFPTGMEFEEEASMHCNSESNKNISNSLNQGKPKQQDKSGGLQKFLEILLPFIMRLFLSQSITDKIECFVEMGKLWKVEAVVDSMLQSLNMSSISNSQ